MTKKHYEAIARIILQCEMENESRDMLVYMLADYFAQDNPRFDRVRFITACGIEQSIDYCHNALHGNNWGMCPDCGKPVEP